MPEMLESAPTATPAADPTPAPSTAEIASQNFDAFESGTDPGDESPIDTAPPTSGEGQPTAAQAPAPAPMASPEDAEIEALLAEFGFKEAKKPDGRDHYIPRPKVLKMIGSGLKRGKEQWQAERAALEQQTQEVRGALEQLAAGLNGDPEAFLSELATVNPAFQRYLRPAEAAGAAAKPAQGRPEPDLDLGDGTRTYSPQGLESLLQWQIQQVLDQRLTPIERQAQQREREAAEQAQRASVQQALQEATGWAEFGALPEDGSLTPFQQAVLDTLRQDSQQAARERRRPSMTLRQAYLEVYAKHLSTNRGAVRESVLQELGQAAKAPALSRGASEAPGRPAPTTADAAARALARLERS